MLTDDATKTFSKYFRIAYANTPELMAQVHKIRYDVFCKELELEQGCPTDVEADEFDGHACHFLLQHRSSQRYAGTIRMVIPPEDQPELKIPLEKYCLHAVDSSIVDIPKLPRGSFAEVSRLAVPATFRKRSGERGKPFIVPDKLKEQNEEERRQFPHIAIGLYLTTAAVFVQKQLDYVFVMVEPRLARSMSRIGLHFEQMGDVIEYHGSRAPFFITQKMLKDHLKPEIKDLFRHICSEVAREFPADPMPALVAG